MSSDNPIERPSGGDAPEGPASLDDLVDEASLESFPCSDPPTFTSLHAGMPAPPAVSLQTPKRETPRGNVAGRRKRRARTLALAHGIFYAASGLWPVVHMRSFEAVTGRKHDRWLVRTVGLLITSIGGVLLASARSGHVTKATALLGASAPAALATIDIVYTATRTIPKVYLLDAAVELGLASAWARLHRGLEPQ